MATDSHDLNDLFDEIATANRILAREGIVDGFGHVSARHPGNRAEFLIARSMAPALVTAEDVMILDAEGKAVGGASGRPYLERHIHAGIYRARPDVQAIVHSHSPAVIPFGAVAEASLRPIFHMSGFLSDGVARYDIRDSAGEASDLLIRTSDLGQDLATCLGTGAAVLMRGHGITVVGLTLRQAVFRAVYTEVNARLQAKAMQMGRVTYLTDAEGRAAAAANDSQIDRAWDLWAREVDRSA